MFDHAEAGPREDRHSTRGSAAAPAPLEVGTYLTNEVFLYRVVDIGTTAFGATADIEDCYRLDVVRVAASDLAGRRLRIVTAA